MLNKAFYKLEDLPELGIPLSIRTLRNKLRGGMIVFGGGQPSLQVRHVGGKVVIAAADLTVWLRAMGGLPPLTDTTSPSAVETEAPHSRRRPGRPRKAVSGGRA